jgi:hypothetical protein
MRRHGLQGCIQEFSQGETLNYKDIEPYLPWLYSDWWQYVKGHESLPKSHRQIIMMRTISLEIKVTSHNDLVRM